MGGAWRWRLLCNEVWTWNWLLARPKPIHHCKSRFNLKFPVYSFSFFHISNFVFHYYFRLSWRVERKQWWRPPRSPAAVSTLWSLPLQLSARSRRTWGQPFRGMKNSRSSTAVSGSDFFSLLSNFSDIVCWIWICFCRHKRNFNSKESAKVTVYALPYRLLQRGPQLEQRSHLLLTVWWWIPFNC